MYNNYIGVCTRPVHNSAKLCYYLPNLSFTFLGLLQILLNYYYLYNKSKEWLLNIYCEMELAKFIEDIVTLSLFRQNCLVNFSILYKHT